MKLFLIINLIFIFAVFAGVLYLTIQLFSASVQIKQLNKYIKFAKDKINSVRYGNFQLRIQNEKDTLGLYKSLNDLFESIYDRNLVINEYREKEKENLNLKEEFIAALTHDLKVPIIAQNKTYDLFLQNKFGQLNDVQKDVILKLKDSTTDLMEMVNSMVETYKIENAGIELNIQTGINVAEFLIECIAAVKSLASSGGKTLNFKNNTRDLRADFDKFLIKRVVNNLIVNALSHSKTEKIDIYLTAIADTFSIDVVDYGQGIDEDEIKKIFNKYYSITNKPNRISSGLGLYLSNKIVKKHKGIIEAESKLNEGSLFRIILPVKNKN